MPATPPPAPDAPQTDASPAERRTSARWGAVLFRNRSWLPVPFLLVALLVPAHSGPSNWLVGAALVVIGEGVRLAGVAAAGKVTRRRSRDVQRLVTYGIFQWVRNPLYFGNFFIWIGFVVISGVLWFIPLAILIFAIEYSLIVRYEEGVLESIFGPPYLAYKAATPRWFPRPPPVPQRGPHDWFEAWRSELSTFMQYVALAAAFVVKAKLYRR